MAGTPSDALPPSRTSKLIGNRYELLSQLGEGGMGVVYEARDRLSGNRVALKRVPLEIIAGTLMSMPRTRHSRNAGSTDRRAMRQALAQEFHTLASLRHPNIISVLDYGFDDEQIPFFTMELLANPKTLVAAGAARTLDTKIDLLVQLLRALTYLHRRRIIHRVRRHLTPPTVKLIYGSPK